jgi:hypothetical protein
MLRAIDRHALSSKQRKQVKAFIAAHSCKGAKCAECGSLFTVSRGDGKKVAIFPNGVGGISLYVLCAPCGVSLADDRALIEKAMGSNSASAVFGDKATRQGQMAHFVVNH